MTTDERTDVADNIKTVIDGAETDPEFARHLYGSCRGMWWNTDEPGVYHCYCGARIVLATGQTQ